MAKQQLSAESSKQPMASNFSTLPPEERMRQLLVLEQVLNRALSDAAAEYVKGAGLTSQES